MTYEEFREVVLSSVQIGDFFYNPGGGTSEIVSVLPEKDRIYYRRGRSRLPLELRTCYQAYSRFKGRVCTSSDLRLLWPEIFDSKLNGHSCNCTTFFMLMESAGLSGPIHGRGVRGDPFWVELYE